MSKPNQTRNAPQGGKSNASKEEYRSTYKGKNKRSSYKKTSDDASKADAGSKTTDKSWDSCHTNDISWWNNSPMFDDATRVPFNRIAGAPIIYDDSTRTIGTTTLTNLVEAMPGIMAFDVLPNIGPAFWPNDPVNRAFTSLYGDIYSKTTGAMQFQQADLALFILSLTSISNLIAHVKRILGVSQFYNGQNYYYPMALLTALGVNPTDVIGKQDLIRMRLNNSILSFNNLKVPDILPLYVRQYALFHSIYADEDAVTAQLYLFRPQYYYLYEDTASKCTCEKFETTSLEGYLTAIETGLNLWRNSSDLGLISGSIQRAFSDKAFVTIDYALATDVVVPVVDRNIMWQIQNMDIAEYVTESFDVEQNPAMNSLQSAGMYDFQGGFDFLRELYLTRPNKILRSFDGVTDSEFIMEATRLVHVPLPETYEEPFVIRPNTELIAGMTIYTYVTEGGLPVLKTDNSTWGMIYITDSMDQPTTLRRMQLITRLTKFKFAPKLYIAVSNGTDVAFTDASFIGDVYRYTTVDESTLVGLNEAAMQSIYATDYQGLKPMNSTI